MAEMNMVPFIDVMLVLLIIFMATAPMISTGIVDLPTVGKAAQRPTSVVEVIIGSDEKLRLRLDGSDPKATSLKALAADVKALQAGNAKVPVVISAEKTVQYEAVVRAMDVLQRSGVQRVGLTVKQGG
jgi:biopolymer transport protein TolR